MKIETKLNLTATLMASEFGKPVALEYEYENIPKGSICIPFEQCYVFFTRDKIFSKIRTTDLGILECRKLECGESFKVTI